MKEKTIISAFTLVGSLATYFYAKTLNKDVVPYVMIGGFIGAVIGEAIVESKNKNNKNKN